MMFPKLMGILNVTPDSFSDGGDNNGDAGAAAMLARVQALLNDGADIIDIGAESTRPGATVLSAEEEWQRLEGILPEAISRIHAAGKQVSVDTRHPETAARAIGLGVDTINDVSGCTNPQMLAVLADSSCDIIFMHSLTIPADKSITLPEDVDVIEALKAFAAERAAECEALGIKKERLIFDPGIGFGKTAKQSIDILKRAPDLNRLGELGLKLLIGHSRKSFLAEFTDCPATERDSLTLAVSQYLLQHSVDIIRVHNVALHHELFQLTHALHALK